MPNKAIRSEARTLMRCAKVPVLHFTLFYLGLRLLFDEIRVALDSMTQQELPAIEATMQPDELVREFASIFSVHTSAQWAALFLSVFIVLLIRVLAVGYQCYCLGVARGETMPYESLFDGFSFVGKALGLTLLLAFLISTGLSLFFVPGVLFYFMYRFALYNLCADPSIGIFTAMKRSRLQTDGRKRELFSLELSFLPLFLLMLAADYLASYLFSPLFPYTLVGNLLFTLCASLPMYVVSAYLTPYRELSFAMYFTNLTQSEELTPTVSDN